MFAVTIDELLIKPLLVTPAANLAEGQLQVSAESPATESAGSQTQENTDSSLTLLSKVVVSVVFIGETVGAITTLAVVYRRISKVFRSSAS